MSPNSPLANSAATPGVGTAAPKPLSERMRETLRRYHYSLRTEESYLMWCRQFVALVGATHEDIVAVDVLQLLQQGLLDLIFGDEVGHAG